MTAQTAAQKIQEKFDDLKALILSGKKTSFTAKELNAYFLEPKEKVDLVTVPEFGLGPIADNKLALAARSWAAGFNSTMSKDSRSYEFSIPAGNGGGVQVREILVEVPVEKIVVKEVPVEVEKVVYKEVPGQAAPAQETHLRFPETPAIGKLNPDYQTPPWAEDMSDALEDGRHVSIAGPPGIGKSTAPEQYFAKKGQPFVVVNGDAGFRRKDIEGTKEVSQGSTYFQVADFAAAAVNGWGVILNEVNAADPDATIWINGILEVPNVVTINGQAFPVHPDFRLVVTYNPGLIGTKPLAQAFKDRFFPIKLGFPHKDFLRKLVCAKMHVSPVEPWMERLLQYAVECWELHERGTLRYQISPRRLFDAVLLLKRGRDLDVAIKKAIIDSVDSVADVGTMMKLVTTAAGNIKGSARFT